MSNPTMPPGEAGSTASSKPQQHNSSSGGPSYRYSDVFASFDNDKQSAGNNTGLASSSTSHPTNLTPGSHSLGAPWQHNPSAPASSSYHSADGAHGSGSAQSHQSSADAYRDSNLGPASVGAGRATGAAAAAAGPRQSLDIVSESHPLASRQHPADSPPTSPPLARRSMGAVVSGPAAYAAVPTREEHADQAVRPLPQSFSSPGTGYFAGSPSGPGVSAADYYYASPPGQTQRGYLPHPGTPGTPQSFTTSLPGSSTVVGGGESVRSMSPGLYHHSMGRSGSVASGSIHGLIADGGNQNRHTMDSALRDEYLAKGPHTAQGTPGTEGGYAYDYSSGKKATPPGVRRYAGLGDGTSRGLFGRKNKWDRDGRPHYSNRKKAVIVAIAAVILAVICAAVVVPVTLKFLPSNKSNPIDPNTGQPADDGSIVNNQGNRIDTSGVNGSTITMANGSTFTYINPFGGRWVSGLLNNSAQAQSYTPPLSQEFVYGAKSSANGKKKRQAGNANADGRILGVNLGGWLVTEPFIVPALYEPYANTSTPALDEFDLSTRYLSEGGADNLRNKMTQHYDTFITEQDFAQIAGAGLNWVRLPMGFWAIETIEGEPFLQGVSWQYVLKAIEWARKYGLRINLDIHALPGSTNAYNHGGKVSTNFTTGINWLNGPMGLANAQRSLNYIRQLAEFVSQPDIRPVVPMLTVINEPNLPQGIGQPNLESWYAQVYSEMRTNITGLGAGHGSIMAVHEGFLGLQVWESFLQGADRLFWDVHPYIAFSGNYTDNWSQLVPSGCNYFGPLMDRGLAVNGVSFAGEWSLATNDCGLYLNGVNLGTRYEGTYPGSTQSYGSCGQWTNWPAYNDTMKQNLMQFARISFDSLKNGFFWTWKIGPSSVTGKVETPQWSYQLGYENGWIPKDPYHDTIGACQQAGQSLSVSIAPTTSWSSTFAGWQTGNTASPYTVNPAQYTWPPSSISNAGVPVTAMPSYTPTGPISKLPTPSYSESQRGKANPTISDWFQNTDSAPFYAKVQGCTYATDQYTVLSVPGSWPCTGAAAKRAAPTPTPTPAT